MSLSPMRPYHFGPEAIMASGANSCAKVASGLVASLARPGGNVTGLSSQGSDTVGKRLELMRAIVPGRRRLAVLGNIDNPFAVLEMDEIRATAGKLGLEVTRVEIQRGAVPEMGEVQAAARTLGIEVAPGEIRHCGKPAFASWAICPGGRIFVFFHEGEPAHCRLVTAELVPLAAYDKRHRLASFQRCLEELVGLLDPD